ncbi:hypothetical protein L615_000500000730 [Nocardioides sp. J9]|uniref:hypothetical protein n=1 Tax=unclassified Nocardioides TaxID=2615069 RepID=UPI00048F4D7F|nr:MULTISPECIES: hypothetical protein [unclassified Nocardioides]TWG95129.1 hypothetical protein L615_000500000730 [Nocardioides sp. J9]
MARRVFIHIGLPKTATSYLQTILWSSRDQLRADGLLLPGRERRDHLWASRVVRGSDGIARRAEHERTSWERLRAELADWDGDGLVSHEFFAAASSEQAVGMVEALAPAQVEVVVTAREPLGLFTASWQESLKNRSTTPMADYSRAESPNPGAIWNWRTLDLRLVLERWSAAVPHDRIHVLPLDRTAPRDEIWHRFGGLLGLPTADYDLSQSFPNESMGVVEAELLRRVNAHLDSFDKAFDRGVYIRTFLADERLVPRKGEKFWPYPDQVEECRRRSLAAIDYLREHGVDVVGDVDHLRVPDELPERRTPDSVTDAEVAAAATELVAVLLGDVRELRNAARRGGAEAAPGLADRLRKRLGRWRSPRRSGGR